jgi:hypothetical protein
MSPGDDFEFHHNVIADSFYTWITEVIVGSWAGTNTRGHVTVARTPSQGCQVDARVPLG